MGLIDLVGRRFGRLTVISRAENTPMGSSRWNCICDCGNATISNGMSLRLNKSLSCGCLRNELSKLRKTKHGMSYSRIYRIWSHMKTRCYNSTYDRYKDYGGRGIKMCDEWKDSFENFLGWSLANGYQDTLTIDRINNDGFYEPSNCRWSTMKAQSNNRRNSKKKGAQ